MAALRVSLPFLQQWDKDAIVSLFRLANSLIALRDSSECGSKYPASLPRTNGGFLISNTCLRLDRLDAVSLVLDSVGQNDYCKQLYIIVCTHLLLVWILQTDIRSRSSSLSSFSHATSHVLSHIDTSHIASGTPLWSTSLFGFRV